MDNKYEQIREISGEETRLYRQTAILAILDTPHVNYSNVSLELVRNPVPVTNDSGEMIGFASVFLSNGKIIAHVAIDYSTPERLAAEVRDGVRHWVRIEGSVNYLNEIFVDTTRITAKNVTVFRLQLSTRRPSDVRLAAFGEPVIH